ncbi:MAG: metal-dependent transcriptional regulator [Ignisphaera sp.]|nr:metal-dependent transcriptional regulator [Ignisphaera sp.]MCX8167737.1 metal-dependent transcriptional regulator [Ignisphaera sp.]MDW8085301.1 metal-dependent transcriptional regulator [Ignisphaera sp.]
MVVRNSDRSLRALEDYLMAIYRLEEIFGEARTTVLTNELGVKPATISKTVSKLAEKNLIVWEPYRGVKLSEKGRAIAERIVRRHRIAEYFLVNVLNMDAVKAHRYAHMMEHLPEEFFDKLYDFLGRPLTCPHGNPIPGATPPSDIIGAKPLLKFSTGSIIRVVRIFCTVGGEVIADIYKLGIEINKKIKILYSDEKGMVLEINDGEKVLIDYRYALAIYGIPLM